MKQLPVIIRTDLTPEQVRLARIADNRVAEAPWDIEALEAELKEIDLGSFDFDVGKLGIDDSWLEGLDIDIDLGEITPPNIPPVIEQDTPPELPKIPKSKPGDIYLLGNHRVMCGDSTVVKDVSTLLNGNEIDSLITTPPKGLDLNPFLKLLKFSEYSTIYCFGRCSLHRLIQAYIECDMHYSQVLTWIHGGHAIGNDYKRKTEHIVYGWKYKHKFYGEYSTDLLEYPKQGDLKPTDLLSKLITDGSDKGALIYDAFGRSGSTLIACEQTGRKAYLMELSPGYVDVIVKRWEDFTGKKATLLTK